MYALLTIDSVPISIDQVPPSDSLFNPRCVFDHDTSRFFFSTTDLTTDGASELLLAVTTGGDPRAGYALFRTLTTNDGTKETPNLTPTCPCYVFQPRLAVGADVLALNGILFSFTGPLVSSDVYVMSKFALAAGEPLILTAAYVNSTATLIEVRLARLAAFVKHIAYWV